MAATLLYIKSRMLLPQYNEEGEIIESEDPRKELVQKLLEYQKFQDAGQQLYSRPLLNRDVYVRGSREDFLGEDGDGEIILEEDGLFSLIGSYRKALRRMKHAVHMVREKVQSISSRVMEIRDRLIVGHRVILSSLVTEEGPLRRGQLLITFLSILELGRMCFVNVFQNETYGDIHVETTKAVEGNVLERVQEFDSADAASVAEDLFAKAAGKSTDQILEGDDGEERAHESAQGQLSLTETYGEEAIERSMEPTAEEMASDDDILAAEAEFAGLISDDQLLVGFNDSNLNNLDVSNLDGFDPGASDPEPEAGV